MNYEAPKLQKFGSFRDLTEVGAAGLGDLSSVHGPNTGCNPNQVGDCARVS